MEIKHTAMAGTLESSDITVEIKPNPENEIGIILESSVEKQFGNQIKKVITDTLKEMNIQSAIVRANDKGALDCVVKARVQAAILRAIDETHFKWEVEN
ncbi:citrate lyase acyl carrier protein [Ectobacillus funiculus]|uniref:Citrate lyase acyl carrier protein n=1 Tax=Ectobacillus funiculus TaxID=137993 RepID=A0ABV5WI59_9BACI